jgi:glycosyltransferase involved in cell wall biosynthesis
MNTALTIGLDAGALTVTDARLKVGVYRMTAGILTQLLGKNRTGTVRAYGFGPMTLDDVGNMQGQLEPALTIPSWGYSSVRLPLELAIRPVDCFIGASQMLPPYIRNPSVGCIYDVSFVTDPASYPESARKLTAQTADLVRRATRIVTISEASKREIIDRFGADGTRITVAYPGIGDVFCDAGSDAGRARPYLLYAGSLKRGKRIPVLFRAYRKAVDRLGDSAPDLVLAGGDFWRDPDIDRAVEELRLKDKVSMTGYVSDTVLASLYRSAVAFVSVSVGEGFCIPAAEAMRCGCPVIGVREAAMPETVGPGGILAGRDDEAGLASAMVMYATDAGRRARDARNGRDHASRFTWAAFGDRLWAAVEAAVGGK